MTVWRICRWWRFRRAQRPCPRSRSRSRPAVSSHGGLWSDPRVVVPAGAATAGTVRRRGVVASASVSCPRCVCRGTT